MFDLLHMDLRRLVRDRALYIILAVFGVILPVSYTHLTLPTT